MIGVTRRTFNGREYSLYEANIPFTVARQRAERGHEGGDWCMRERCLRRVNVGRHIGAVCLHRLIQWLNGFRQRLLRSCHGVHCCIAALLHQLRKRVQGSKQWNMWVIPGLPDGGHGKLLACLSAEPGAHHAADPGLLGVAACSRGVFLQRLCELGQPITTHQNKGAWMNAWMHWHEWSLVLKKHAVQKRLTFHCLRCLLLLCGMNVLQLLLHFLCFSLHLQQCQRQPYQQRPAMPRHCGRLPFQSLQQ